MDLKIKSQFGRPKEVGARRPVMVSPFSSALSFNIRFVASSSLMLAVRYCIERVSTISGVCSRKAMQGVTYGMDFDLIIQVLSLNCHQ